HWDGEGDGLDPHVTHTDAEGRFSAPGLPAGDYEVRASPPAARDEELAPDAQKTDVLRGHVTRGVHLRFDRQ
ncbi:MAG: carboxypeptidase regulatory-like domain-containing protein, partial [Nannocystaceae bacterium]|nr:carboxypeptidase regulatory-like domain-containing protein [Nannocystaceae bacterium]